MIFYHIPETFQPVSLVLSIPLHCSQSWKLSSRSVREEVLVMQGTIVKVETQLDFADVGIGESFKRDR